MAAMNSKSLTQFMIDLNVVKVTNVSQYTISVPSGVPELQVENGCPKLTCQISTYRIHTVKCISFYTSFGLLQLLLCRDL